jgi:hypothetical protein
MRTAQKAAAAELGVHSNELEKPELRSSLTAIGEGSTSKSSGKHEPTIDAAFARYVGQAYPDFIEIRIGSLDEAPSSGAPERENWIKRRERWLSP